MSDALSDIAKRERNKREYDNAVQLLAKRIHNQTFFMDRLKFEVEATDILEIINDDIIKEVETLRSKK